MEDKMKVLIAYDGVHPVEYFLQDLRRAGLPKDTEALVMTVVDSFMPLEGGYSDPPLPKSTVTYIETMRKQAEAYSKKQLTRAQKLADKAAKRLRAAFRGWTVHSEACIDSPAWAIVKKEEQWKPGLIVVGSHAASAAARFFFGSVARGVLIHSKGSVRIVRKHRKTKQLPRIIIGMDGSLDSQMAVQQVSERRWPAGTNVRLVTGFDQNMAYAIAFHDYPVSKKFTSKEQGENAWIRRMTSPFVEKLENAGLRVSDVIKADKPWKVLVEEAEKWKADCVFVGARGLGRFSRFLLGSVSNAVASRAHCSVEVVRKTRQN